MNILYIASEVKPFAASGGLADVAGSLPGVLRTLRQQVKTDGKKQSRRVHCRVVMPLYGCVKAEFREQMTFLGSRTVPVSWRRQYCGVFELKYEDVTYYFLDNEYYFKRPGIYGHYDDGERFAFFSRAVLEMLWLIDYKPDILHANDWQSALVPIYYSLFYTGLDGYPKMKTVFTIHNIQYQGKYDPAILGDVFGLSAAQYSVVEHDKCVNLMKGGIEAADAVTTVSPTYAAEIQDPWFSFGLDPILRARNWKLTGILNGIDTADNDPAADPVIAQNYSADGLSGKTACKQALQERLGLPVVPDIPLIVTVTRLVSSKGLDLMKYALEDLLRDEVQVAVLGSGDTVYEAFFRDAQRRHPDKFRFAEGFLPDLARMFYAGADIFLMPSKSEPCGLAQMIACRYGTLPVVRETGGLKDSIADCGDGRGFGFTFKTYNAGDMLHGLYRAIGAYQNGGDWPELMRRAMTVDFSWKKSAAQYLEMYEKL